MNEESFANVTDRLRDDADCMLETHEPNVPVRALMIEHQRRGQRRLLVGSSAVLLVLCVVASGTWIVLQPSAPIAKPDDKRREAVVAVPHEPAPSVSPVEPDELISLDAATDQLDGPRPLPVLFVKTTPDGQRVVVPAFYVPGRTETVEFSSLSPAEQRAVRTLLGVDEQRRSRDPI